MNNRTKIVSWALYDAANTIFATNVVSLYFPLWVTVQKGASDNWYILAYYFSIVLAVFILPFFGILSDKLRKYSFFLRIFTLVCITFTASIGLFDNLLAGVVFFVVANLFNQVAANTFYPALLAEVSPADKIPFVSGLGVGLGYIGTIVGLSFARLFVKEANYQNVFLPTASLFLLFSLPCFLFVKDARKEMKMRDSISIIREHLRNFLAAFRTLITNRMLLKFFCSILLMINGVNGVLLNIGVYGRKVMGFLDSELPLFVMFSAVFAFLSSFAFGPIINRLGEKRTLSYVLMGWVVSLVAVALCYSKQLCWIMGPAIGILLAGTWVSSRPLIIKLAPRERVGEFFGFAGLAGIMGTLISPLVWLAVITTFQPLGLVKYRIALGTLALLIFAGFILLRQVPERKLTD